MLRSADALPCSSSKWFGPCESSLFLRLSLKRQIVIGTSMIRSTAAITAKAIANFGLICVSYYSVISTGTNLLSVFSGTMGLGGGGSKSSISRAPFLPILFFIK